MPGQVAQAKNLYFLPMSAINKLSWPLMIFGDLFKKIDTVVFWPKNQVFDVDVFFEECPSNNVFPITLRLLRSIAPTARSGLSKPLMATGMPMILYANAQTRF